MFFFLYGCTLLIEIKVTNHECEQTGTLLMLLPSLPGGHLYIFGGGKPASASDSRVQAPESIQAPRELDNVLSINGSNSDPSTLNYNSDNSNSENSLIASPVVPVPLPPLGKKEVPIIDRNSWMPLSVFFFLIGMCYSASVPPFLILTWYFVRSISSPLRPLKNSSDV